MSTRLEWNPTFLPKAEAALADVLSGIVKIGVREAKADLYPGHGEKTGDLKRSLHGAGPGYNWLGDNVHPTPELGDRQFKPETLGDRIKSAFGSGLDYAIYPHQGTSRMAGYHYLTSQFPAMRDALPELCRQAGRRHGFRP